MLFPEVIHAVHLDNVVDEHASKHAHEKVVRLFTLFRLEELRRDVVGVGLFFLGVAVFVVGVVVVVFRLREICDDAVSPE